SPGEVPRPPHRGAGASAAGEPPPARLPEPAHAAPLPPPSAPLPPRYRAHAPPARLRGAGREVRQAAQEPVRPFDLRKGERGSGREGEALPLPPSPIPPLPCRSPLSSRRSKRR